MATSEFLGQPLPDSIDYNPDEFSCYSSSIGYLMFRLGAPEQLWLPSTIDDITGRESGELTYDTGSGLLALMEQGANIVNVHAFDNERFIEEGLSYLEEYYAKTWLKDDPVNFNEYWQPNRLEAQRGYTANLLDGAKSYGDQWSVVPENPTPDSIRLTLESGDKIIIATRRKEKNILHYPVLLDSRETNALITFDSAETPPILSVEQNYFFATAFNPDWGMVTVGGVG